MYDQHVGWVVPSPNEVDGGRLVPPTRAVTPAELALNPMSLLKDYNSDEHVHRGSDHRASPGDPAADVSYKDGVQHGLYGRYRTERLSGEAGSQHPFGREGDNEARVAMFGRELVDATSVQKVVDDGPLDGPSVREMLR